MARGLTLLALAALGACTGPMPSLGPRISYSALGHDPGWTLTIRGDRLEFAAAEPQMLMELVPPLPVPTAHGRRYATERLTLEITRRPCNDIKSGVAFSETVWVVVDGYNYRGCGGERVPLLNV